MFRTSEFLQQFLERPKLPNYPIKITNISINENHSKVQQKHVVKNISPKMLQKCIIFTDDHRSLFCCEYLTAWCHLIRSESIKIRRCGNEEHRPDHLPESTTAAMFSK